MKFRVIPVILTDGTTVVKGTSFNNWRTVGSAEATSRLFAARDVDELVFLDVGARNKGKAIDMDLVKKFSNQLSIPFAVGGGIDDFDTATLCLRNGAEKIILGTSAFRKPELITKLSETFGAQAVVVTIDVLHLGSKEFAINSGREIITSESSLEFAHRAQDLGAGEIILQCISQDGSQLGYDLDNIRLFVNELTVPIIAGSGAGGTEDFENAFLLGAAGGAAGALFQFTQTTPKEIREDLRSRGVPVRRSS
jgi:cyclase